MPTLGLAPLGRDTLDTLGPITKTVEDAAVALDVISGFGTPSFTGQAPDGGFAALLGNVTLEGARTGLLGPGWRPGGTLEPEIATLYSAALDEMVALGAELVGDPFAGTDFATVLDPYGGFVGFAGAAYDFQNYLKGLDVASLNEFVKIVGANPATPDGPLSFILDEVPKGTDGMPDANQARYSAIAIHCHARVSAVLCTRRQQVMHCPASIAQTQVCPAQVGLSWQADHDPKVLLQVPDLSNTTSAQNEYRRIFAEVFAEHDLDALVYPTDAELLLPITDPGFGNLTTVPEINIAGVPVVVVPSTLLPGPPRPFTLTFVGREYSDATLLALAYDYEQATQRRIVPDLP